MRTLLVSLALLAMAAPGLLAQVSDSHTVTINVNPYDAIDVVNDVTLNVTFDPVTGLGSATDSSSILRWVTNQAGRKVTVYTTVAAPQYPLSVLPGAVTRTVGAIGDEGTPVGAAIDLLLCQGASNAADIVTAIDNAGGWCALTYATSASVADPTGTDVHTVTYTLTN